MRREGAPASSSGDLDARDLLEWKHCADAGAGQGTGEGRGVFPGPLELVSQSLQDLGQLVRA